MAEQPESIPCTVFYSWQSDLSNATNRTFIQNALVKAAKAVRSDESMRIDPVIDRDTQGVPGSPEIARTILNKIANSQVFVGDVSIINSGCDVHEKPVRLTPNPNVLIELGYALHVLGEECLILVTNEAYGSIKQLPFDLNTRRALSYNLPEGASEAERTAQRRLLEGKLSDALRSISSHLENQVHEQPDESVPLSPLINQAITAIDQEPTSQARLVRQYMQQFAAGVAALMPDPMDLDKAKSDDFLVQQIEATRPLMVEYSRLVQAVAVKSASEAAHAMYAGFTSILDLYWTARGFFSMESFELAKFVGYEAFVTLFALLIREERWSLIADLLAEDLYVTVQRGGEPGPVDLAYVSQHLALIEQRGQIVSVNYFALLGTILNERHTQGDLAQLVPMESFAEADYFLYLRAQVSPDERPTEVKWRPWSIMYLNAMPRYVATATRVKQAQRLVSLLGVRDIPILRSRLVDRAMTPEQLIGSPYRRAFEERFDFQTIGTRM